MRATIHFLPRRALIALRGQDEHLFAAFYDPRDKVHWGDVHPTHVPKGSWEVLAVAVDNCGNRSERFLGRMTLAPSEGAMKPRQKEEGKAIPIWSWG